MTKVMSEQEGGLLSVGAINWDSMREWGLSLEQVLLSALPPEELRRLRGPGLRVPTSMPTPDPHPLYDANTPVGVLLSPDLDPQDPMVSLLVQASQWKGIQVFADETLAGVLPANSVTPWEATERNDHVVTAQWQERDKTREVLISRIPIVATQIAGELFPAPPPLAPLELVLRLEAALAFSRSYSSPIHVTATRLPKAIASRATRSGRADWGICSPEEALLVVLMLQAHHGQHLVSASGVVTTQAEDFGWYSGLAQLAVPQYLPVFARLIDEWEHSSGERPVTVDLWQGLIVGVRHLLRIHDDLAWIALREGLAGSDNNAIERQTELVFDAVSVINATLDGLTAWLVEREGLEVEDKERRSVGFRPLRGGRQRWSKGFSRHQAAVATLKQQLPPLLDLATQLRSTGHHRHPLLATGLRFVEWIQVASQTGQPAWRPIREATAGAIVIHPSLIEPHELTYGTDGMIVFSDSAYALPWGFVRALTRDFLQLLASSMEAIAAAEDVLMDRPTSLIDPTSPYAAFTLRYDMPLELANAAD